jgi:hypothetical protein
MKLVRMWSGVVVLGGLAAAVCGAQSEKHGRKYVAPPPTAHIVVTVVRAFNGRPMETVPVIFYATKNGHDTGNMEVRTNTQGEATMDLIEAGSHVTVQVIASGYATDAEEFNVTEADKLVTVKMLRPRAQVSQYTENDEKPSTLQPGTQEHVIHKPAVANSAPATAPATAGQPVPAGSQVVPATPATVPAAGVVPAADPTAPTATPQ